MAARTRRKAAVGDAALERSGCVDGGLWGRERRAFADYCGSRSPGVYADRYACDVCPHRGSDVHAHAGAYTCTYSSAHVNAHAGTHTSSDPYAHSYVGTYSDTYGRAYAHARSYAEFL